MVACDGLRRASLKTVDPAIQKQPRWERERIAAGYRLGPYEIGKPRVRESALDQDLGTPIEGGRRPGWRYELDLVVRAPERSYAAHCIAKRVPSNIADYGEIADVANDVVDIGCEIEGAAKWNFTASGRLDKNVGGDLRRGDIPSAAPLKVEIILWIARLKLLRRHLADPIAQVRRSNGTVAAMIISRPEWAWAQASADAETRGIAMTTLAAVNALPLGWGD
jgi:hypothetical protein